ncbi:MAG: hypothetical protein IBX70_07735 [Clostridia bacterium]|nr:hypothetical protein [Clostridia bacterium]
MHVIYINEIKLFSDYVVYEADSKKLIMANLLERSKYAVQSAVANIYKSSQFQFKENLPTLNTSGDYTGFIQGFSVGKSKYYQGIVRTDLIFNKSSKAIDDTIRVCVVANENQSKEDALFEAIYEMHDLPLDIGWKDYLFSELYRQSAIKKCTVISEERFSYQIKEGNVVTDLANWEYYFLNAKTELIDSVITEGIRRGHIKIAESPQNPIDVKSIDDYFMKYGHKVTENVLKSLKPQIPRIPTISYKAKQKVPFPVQAEVINGIVNHLKTHDYIIINGGMGVGKSFISSVSTAIASTSSRTIVMGPGHMLEKWKYEILDEIHDAKVEIITDFNQVTRLSKLKGIKPSCKEFYLFSKDFAKLSYETIPIVSKSMRKTIPLKECTCGNLYFDSYDHNKCSCGSTEFKKVRSSYKVEGATCPECSETVFPSYACFSSQSTMREEDTNPVDLSEFSNRSSRNSVCGHCGTKLWQPHVKNHTLNNEYINIQAKGEKWIKIKIPRNKSNKTFKTEYMLKTRYQRLVKLGILNDENHSVVSIMKGRRYSPAKYMKKMLGKDFFQYGIYDEVHLYKSGNSAQGNAFGQLLKVTEKSLVLTGTLAGGVAHDLFYLLFRLEPKLLLSEGYSYNDSFKFASDYGVVEETRQFENSTVYYNKTSNGRQVGSKKILPGISPLVFSKLLINNTIFLDLADFEGFLPELIEKPVPVMLEPKQAALYREVQDILKKEVREEGGKKLLGQFLPTLLSLPDLNQLSPIIHPESGNVIYSFKDDPKSFLGEDGLLNKERELLKIIEQELKENRNCFVYCEFTSDGDKNITKRLQHIIEENLNLQGQVAILKASSPKAKERMEWIKQKASEGIKVFITNPRLVETGLDFIFKYQKRVYNYPTIIFYQLGYNLFTSWQASARHRRLIQTLQCRTFYLFYENTLQDIALESLANKKAATAALQGTFSEEGLIAMANSVDPRVLLANAMMNGSQSGNLNLLFEKINERKEIELSEEEKVLMERILENFTDDGNEETLKRSIQLSFTDLADELFELMNISKIENSFGSGKNRVLEGQLSLF